MWAMSVTGHSISHWLPCSVPSWVPNIIGTRGGNSVYKNGDQFNLWFFMPIEKCEKNVKIAVASSVSKRPFP